MTCGTPASTAPRRDFQVWWDRFRTTGNIAPIEWGFSREQVRAILGQPDDVSVAKKGRAPAIQEYGRLEFHFRNRWEDPLALMFMDTPEGTARVSITRID